MKQFFPKASLYIILAVLLSTGFTGQSFGSTVLAQQETQQSSEVYITVTYTEQINIRNGPSTVLYDIIGNMQPGEIAPALGVSPGREWVQIEYPAAPGGIAWVHTSLISITGGELQVIEPPPTPMPLTTPTTDPTLAAAYNFEPTATRLPTFTPPPPLEVPSFTESPAAEDNGQEGLPMGALVLGLGIPGLLALLASSRRR